MNVVITTFIFILLSVFKTKIANELVIHNFGKEFEHESERSSGYNLSQE